MDGIPIYAGAGLEMSPRRECHLRSGQQSRIRREDHVMAVALDEVGQGLDFGGRQVIVLNDNAAVFQVMHQLLLHLLVRIDSPILRSVPM